MPNDTMPKAKVRKILRDAAKGWGRGPDGRAIRKYLAVVTMAVNAWPEEPGTPLPDEP